MSNETAEKTAPLEIGIENIKEMLSNGKTRQEIAAHYGIPLSYLKENVFNHPDLKGLKTKKTYNIKLVARENVAENASQTLVEDTEENNQLGILAVEENEYNSESED